MEHLGGDGPAFVGPRENIWGATPFTIRMPISRDHVSPLPLHIVKSAIWYESGPPDADNDDGESKPEYFKKFSPISERNALVPREKANSLRYSTNQGTIDIISLPLVPIKDIRIEVHEQQITIVALARNRTLYTEIGIIDEDSPPDMIYTFNTEAKNIFAIVAGYRGGQVQLFLGRTKPSPNEQQNSNTKNKPKHPTCCRRWGNEY